MQLSGSRTRTGDGASTASRIRLEILFLTAALLRTNKSRHINPTKSRFVRKAMTQPYHPFYPPKEAVYKDNPPPYDSSDAEMESAPEMEMVGSAPAIFQYV